MSGEKSNICTVCERRTEAIHYHHVIPQAFGGKGGPEVPLCGDCHTTVHAHALAILSFQRSGGKNKIKQFWSTSTEEENAIPLVTQIVQAALNYDGDKSYKMVCEFSSDVYSKLRFLKRDLALASLEDALIYCVNYVFDKHGTNNNSNNRKKINEKRIRMW